MRLTVRHLVRGTGQHRKPPTPAVPGALVGQRFVHCDRCGGVESAATVHGDQLRCAEGHLVVPGVADG